MLPACSLSAFRISVHWFGRSGPWFSMWDLVPWPGIEPWPLALGARSLSAGPPGESSTLYFKLLFKRVCLCTYVCTYLHGCVGEDDMEPGWWEKASTGGPEVSRKKPAKACRGSGFNGRTQAEERGGLQNIPESVFMMTAGAWWASVLCGAQCWADVAHFTSVSKVLRSTCFSADKTGIQNSKMTSETSQPAASWELSAAPEPLPFPLHVSTFHGWTSMFMFIVMLLQQAKQKQPLPSLEVNG